MSAWAATNGMWARSSSVRAGMDNSVSGTLMPFSALSLAPFGPAEVIELIRMRAADIINIKLMKTGGISNAVRIADIAERERIALDWDLGYPDDS